MTSARAFYTPAEVFERVEPLVDRRTGLIARAQELPATAGSPDLCVYVAELCEVNRLSTATRVASDDGLKVVGAGASLDRQIAQAKAYCEAIERYCNLVPTGADSIVASRDELGDEAVDLRLFPRCSPAEYAHPHCPVVPADHRLPMRWTRAYSLITGQPRWVPLVAVYLGAGFRYRGENFTLPISTGCAVAASYEQATVTGICEVVERDGLMLTWLQQLPLPRLEPGDGLDPGLAERLDRLRRAGLEVAFFDATTDLGIPTIYALILAPQGPIAVLVMASTRLQPAESLSKVLDEAGASRLTMEQLAAQPALFDPTDFASFSRLTDGAVFYAAPENRRAFDFLLDHGQRRTLDELPVLETGDPMANLDRLVTIFRQRGLELLVADLTLPPVRAAGLAVVKVIAPQLMPLTPSYCARYTATPRLYSAPAQMGYPVHRPPDLNPWPQPFA